MDTDRCVQHDMALSQFDDNPAGVYIESRDQDMRDSGLGGAFQHSLPVGVESIQIQMAVSVSQQVGTLISSHVGTFTGIRSNVPTH